MAHSIIRMIAAGVILACLAACGLPVGPAGVPSSTDVNPITGDRGGSSSR